MGWYVIYGYVFLINGEVKVCGEVDLGLLLYFGFIFCFGSGVLEVKFLFMGKS